MKLSIMYPNERYADHFPDAPMPEERPEADRSCAIRIGSYAVIKKVLEDYKLPGMPDSTIPTMLSATLFSRRA